MLQEPEIFFGKNEPEWTEFAVKRAHTEGERERVKFAWPSLVRPGEPSGRRKNWHRRHFGRGCGEKAGTVDEQQGDDDEAGKGPGKTKQAQLVNVFRGDAGKRHKRTVRQLLE